MIEVITACDDNYIQHLGVMLCSLLENTPQKSRVNISVIDGGITNDNKNKLSSFIKDTYKLNIKYLIIDPQIYSEFQISYHFTHTIYYRISIPSLLLSDISKALYLDCDLVLKDDIGKLWSYDLGEYCLAAVESVSIDKEHLRGIIPSNASYFNSGVLLINLSKWRESNITQQVIQFIKNYQDKIIWWDQDSLNVILYKQWLSLPLKWNQQTNFFEISTQKTDRKDELMEAINSPSIIHYTGLHKPWEYIDNHPYKYEYYNYLSLTPWNSFIQKKSFRLFFEKIIRNYTPTPILSTLKSLSCKLFSR